MIVKAKDHYINLDNAKIFEIKISEYNGGISIYVDGNEYAGGEEIQTVSKMWADIINLEFERALLDERWFFDLSSYLTHEQTPFIKRILNAYDDFIAAYPKED